MTGSFLENIPGQTPIDDLGRLIPKHITTQEELNEWEARNILEATDKYLSKRKGTPFTVEFLRILHRDMFSQTWDWAGKFRERNLNIGIDWPLIREQLKLLVDDVAFWREGKSGLTLIQQNVRIHHRLTLIHPFVNGNGRQARLAADIFLFNNDHQIPVWPTVDLIKATNIRKRYIEALHEADQGDYLPLETLIGELMP